MNVFIDTNSLLDFFRLSGGDLDEIQKIIRLWTNQQIKLLVPDRVRDEFYRNRERVITEAIDNFKKSNVELHRPNLVRGHAESDKLQALSQEFKQVKATLHKKVVEESLAKKTKADCVIDELFNAADVCEIDAETVKNGMHRSDLGQPPGKAGSCGDAINWEWLLKTVPDGDDLCVISGDGDFASPLLESELSSYLNDEWAKKKNSNCKLYRSLTDFLKDKFPDFRLADEADKDEMVVGLATSPNFATTHNLVAKLASLDSYSKPQLLKIIDAFETNNQVSWILGDRDVSEFGRMVIDMAYKAGLEEEVRDLRDRLNDLEEDKQSQEEIIF